MDDIHGISAADRRLARHLLIALAAIVAAVAAFSRLDLLYSHKFFDITGRAQWIWPQLQISSGRPVAFFATRDFELPPNRTFTRIKVAGDPEYTLYFNGAEIGGRRTENQIALDVYDVSRLARDQGNRIVIAARSPDGVGGVIASVDVSEEYQNVVPTGREWTIVRRWSDDLLAHDPAPAETAPPVLMGRPPAGRWNYLERRLGIPTPLPRRLIQPLAAFHFRTALPDIEIRSGVAVAGSQPTGAIAYDFGPVAGRARLTVAVDNPMSRAIRVRFANDRAELVTVEGPVETFVIAPGERTITDPRERQFRYVMVYGSQATVSVAQ